MNIICEVIFGSRLYGLENENSDFDYKGIILPTSREILLGNAKYHKHTSTGQVHTKNSSTDIDRGFYTLSYFIDLACKGDTTAIDMLHADISKTVQSSEAWEYLQNNRALFYTKNMKAYVGYCRKQAAKYGIKGSRLGELERAIQVISSYSTTDVMGDVEIEESDIIKWIDYKGNRYLEVCGSKFQDNLRIPYALNTLEKIFSNYGERTKLAKLNESVDWKAMTHAFRAGYQTLHILQDNGFEYPLPETEFLKEIKAGQHHFLDVEPQLTQLIQAIESESEKSNLPDNVDKDFWDQYLYDFHRRIVTGERNAS